MEDNQKEEGEIFYYGDPNIASADAPIPGWLKFSNIFWIIFGLFWLYFFWNGSYGWLDRGYWHQLQQAANTTVPFTNSDFPPEKNM